MELAILARLSAQQTPKIFYFCPPHHYAMPGLTWVLGIRIQVLTFAQLLSVESSYSLPPPPVICLMCYLPNPITVFLSRLLISQSVWCPGMMLIFTSMEGSLEIPKIVLLIWVIIGIFKAISRRIYLINMEAIMAIIKFSTLQNTFSTFTSLNSHNIMRRATFPCLPWGFIWPPWSLHSSVPCSTSLTPLSSGLHLLLSEHGLE